MYHRTILTALALALAFAALAAPTALAEPRGPGNPADSVTSVTPDDRPFARDESRREADPSVSPDDRPLPRGPLEPTSRPMVSSDSDAFQWLAAGVGAATMLGFILLIGATAFVVRHERGRIAAS